MSDREDLQRTRRYLLDRAFYYQDCIQRTWARTDLDVPTKHRWVTDYELVIRELGFAFRACVQRRGRLPRPFDIRRRP